MAILVNRALASIRQASTKSVKPGDFTLKHPNTATVDKLVKFEAENFYTTGSDYIGSAKFGNIGQFVSDQAVADKLHFLHQADERNITYVEHNETKEIIGCFTRYVGTPGEILDPNEYHVIWPEKLNFELAYGVGLFRLTEMLAENFEPWVHIHTMTVHKDIRGIGGLSNAATAEYHNNWPSDVYHHIGMVTSEFGAQFAKKKLPEGVPRDSVRFFNTLEFEDFVASDGTRPLRGKTNEGFWRCYLTEGHIYKDDNEAVGYSATA